VKRRDAVAPETHDAVPDYRRPDVAAEAAVEVTYSSDTRSVAAARHELVRFLGRVDEAARERAMLVVSELMSNAVEASTDPITLSLESSGGTEPVQIRVRNVATDDDFPDREDWGPDEPLARRGRGLAIVDTLAESVEVKREGDWVVVTARMPMTPNGPR
jgi:anti-sigma regulatory factor (Ser/Thr protein kinase)